MSQYLAFIQLFARVGAIATVVALFLLSVVDIMGAIYLTNAVAVVNYFLTMLLSRFYGKK